MPTLKYTSPHNTIIESYITKPILDLAIFRFSTHYKNSTVLS